MNAMQLVVKGAGTLPRDAAPDSDPLTVEDALQEAQLIDVRMEAIESRVALLFDLRLALQLRLGNAGLMVLRGVETFAWSQERRLTGRTAWNVVGSTSSAIGGVFHLKLSFVPDAELHVTAYRGVDFYEVEMPGLPATPPDYTREDDAAIDAGVPRWDAMVKVLGSSSLVL